MPGYAFCGTLDMENETIKGFAFSERPSHLTGSWQHMNIGASIGFILVELTKWDVNTQTNITVASIEYELTGLVDSWTEFSLPFTYYESMNPDTCIIAFLSSTDEPIADEYLYIDNLSFTGNVSGMNENSAQQMHVYPNPAKNQITIESSDKIDQNGTISIVNLIGKIVVSEPLISNKQTIKIENLKNGIYFVNIKTKEGTTTQKVIVNR